MTLHMHVCLGKLIKTCKSNKKYHLQLDCDEWDLTHMFIVIYMTCVK